ncbi:hypothetical protein A2U01_0092397, partial [Trifolium medium]|nr:hypothetical protein [Trifolium medium]
PLGVQITKLRIRLRISVLVCGLP